MRRMAAVTLPGPVAAFLWALALPDAGVWPAGPALVIGIWMVAAATVALTGIVAGASRWAHRLGLAVAVAGLAIAVVVPVTPLWWAAVAASGLSLVALAGPPARGLVRQRQAAGGPPRRAVALGLVLFAAPAVTAVSAVDGLGTGWLWVAGSILVLAVYLRAAPGALLAVRALAPAMAVAGAVDAPLPVSVTCLLGGAAVAGLAWGRSVRLSIRPLVEPGRAVPIPPELAPGEVLDAAGVDSSGRRKAGS